MNADIVESLRKASDLLSEAWTRVGAAKGTLEQVSPRLTDDIANVDRQLEIVVRAVRGACSALEEVL